MGVISLVMNIKVKLQMFIMKYKEKLVIFGSIPKITAQKLQSNL